LVDASEAQVPTILDLIDFATPDAVAVALTLADALPIGQQRAEGRGGRRGSYLLDIYVVH